MQALIALFLGSLISVLALERCVTGFWKTCAVSALICSLGLQVINYFVVGYLDPFTLIAVIIGWGLAFLVSMMWLGILLKLKKRR